MKGVLFKTVLEKGCLKFIRVINLAVFKYHLSTLYEFGCFWGKGTKKMSIMRNNSDDFLFGHDPNLKSVNLQYNTLGRLDTGTNKSSTKHLMFQVLFFHNFLWT